MIFYCNRILPSRYVAKQQQGSQNNPSSLGHQSIEQCREKQAEFFRLGTLLMSCWLLMKVGFGEEYVFAVKKIAP